MRIRCVRRDKRLRLGRDRREQTGLIEPDTVTAATIMRIFEPGASNLEHVSELVRPTHAILPSASYNSHKQWQFAGVGLPGDRSVQLEQQQAANKGLGDTQLAWVEVGMGLGGEAGAYGPWEGPYGMAHAVVAGNVAQVQEEADRKTEEGTTLGGMKPVGKRL